MIERPKRRSIAGEAMTTRLALRLGLAGAVLTGVAVVASTTNAVASTTSAVASTTTAGAVEKTCAKPKPKVVADAWRTCEWDGDGKKPKACKKYSPIASDRCTAEATRSAGVAIDYSYFGEVDCRAWDEKRTVKRIVIHNGDHGKANNDSWKCRPSAAHYTVDRDGKIFQHVGEERSVAHANTENSDTIGIELAIKRKYKGTCNSLPDLAKVAKAEGIAPEDVVADMCGPSDVQYAALAKLVADIKTRHPIAADGVFGHCEVKASDHGDPKAFDWRRVGAKPRKGINSCAWYHVLAKKGTVGALFPSKGGIEVEIAIEGDGDIEVGDHGWIENDKETIKAWFTVREVKADLVKAWVPVSFADIATNLHATVVATPGKTPTALTGKALGSTGGTTVAGKPKLGSCETDFTYWKSGKIKSWTTRRDGTIATVTLEGAGWKHRVCDDAAGMIYVGDGTDSYVTDAAGKKLRFKMTSVDESTAVAEVFEGSVSVAELGQNRRVVVRSKK